MTAHTKKFIYLIAVLGCFHSSFAQRGMDSLMLVMNKNRLKYKRWSCDMNVNFRFLKTSDSYNVQRYDEIEQSRRFNAVHVGFDAGYDFLYLPKHKITALEGVGYERFNALQRDNAAELGPVDINTYNIN
jgi:hypothetical protein